MNNEINNNIIPEKNKNIKKTKKTIIIMAVLLSIVLAVLMIPNLIANAPQSNNVYQEYEGELGELPVIDEDEPSMATLYRAENKYDYVNRYQGCSYPLNNSGGTIAYDDEYVYSYKGNKLMKQKFEEDTPHVLIEDCRIKQLTYSGELITAIFSQDSMGGGTIDALVSINKRNGLTSKFNMTSEGAITNNTIYSYYINESTVYLTKSIYTDSILLIDRVNGTLKNLIKLKSNNNNGLSGLFDQTLFVAPYIVTIIDDDIYYIMDETLYKYNTETEETKILAERTTVEQKPIIYEDSLIKFNRKTIYINNTPSTTMEEDISTINIYNNQLMIAHGNTIDTLNLDTGTILSIYKCEENVEELYVCNNYICIPLTDGLDIINIEDILKQGG